MSRTSDAPVDNDNQIQQSQEVPNPDQITDEVPFHGYLMVKEPRFFSANSRRKLCFLTKNGLVILWGSRDPFEEILFNDVMRVKLFIEKENDGQRIEIHLIIRQHRTFKLRAFSEDESKQLFLALMKKLTNATS